MKCIKPPPPRHHSTVCTVVSPPFPLPFPAGWVLSGVTGGGDGWFGLVAVTEQPAMLLSSPGPVWLTGERERGRNDVHLLKPCAPPPPPPPFIRLSELSLSLWKPPDGRMDSLLSLANAAKPSWAAVQQLYGPFPPPLSLPPCGLLLVYHYYKRSVTSVVVAQSFSFLTSCTVVHTVVLAVRLLPLIDRWRAQSLLHSQDPGSSQTILYWAGQGRAPTLCSTSTVLCIAFPISAKNSSYFFRPLFFLRSDVRT